MAYVLDTKDEPFFGYCFRERSPSNISPKVRTHARFDVHLRETRCHAPLYLELDWPLGDDSISRHRDNETTNSGEPGYEFFVPSTSVLCATSGCFVNWSCRGDFDEQESSSGERLYFFGFEGVEVDDAATRYSMICEGRSDFTINPLVPCQVPEPDSASRSNETIDVTRTIQLGNQGPRQVREGAVAE